jgi:hypothetical protein
LKRRQEFPLRNFGLKRIDTFSNNLRTKSLGKRLNSGKEYLDLLMEVVRVEMKDIIQC